MTEDIVFWDVDTQKDFMGIKGALYIEDAIYIRPNLDDLTWHAKDSNIRILGSVDRHFADDDELAIFPKHCMDGTTGQEKIPETLLDHHVFVPSKIGMYGRYEELSNNEIQIYERSYRQIIFEKQTTNVFDNRNVIKFLDKIRVKTAIVYGVATEFCVKDAVLGLRKLGIEVYLVKDAIKEISDGNGLLAIATMVGKGVTLIDTVEVINGWYP